MLYGTLAFLLRTWDFFVCAKQMVNTWPLPMEKIKNRGIHYFSLQIAFHMCCWRVFFFLLQKLSNPSVPLWKKLVKCRCLVFLTLFQAPIPVLSLLCILLILEIIVVSKSNNGILQILLEMQGMAWVITEAQKMVYINSTVE